VRKRKLGRTQIEIGELALGTWGLSGDGYGHVTEAVQDRVIERALNMGVSFFDTADVYGKGEMEKRLGRLLPKDTTQVCTKIGTDLQHLPPIKRFDMGYLRESFERCQERLQRETIDVLLLHNPTLHSLGTSAALDFLSELKKRGKIRAYGVSAGDSAVARAAIDHGAEVVELAYNVFFADDLHELSDDIAQKDIGVIARSILAHGLLAGHWSAEREFYPGDHRQDRWTPNELRTRIRQLDAIRPLVGGVVMTLRAAALRFVLSNDLVSCAVLGPKSVAQLDQLLREAGWGPPYLKDTAMAELSARLKSVGITL
jgi:aryl-alcohol dehydrogenase-like predicted oxidoreductase